MRALADHQPAFAGSNEGEDLPEDFLEKIAAQLRGLEGLEGLLGEEGNTGGPAAGRGDVAGEAPSGDFPGMASLVDTIMHQLLSKEVLYQPMKVSKGVDKTKRERCTGWGYWIILLMSLNLYHYK